LKLAYLTTLNNYIGCVASDVNVFVNIKFGRRCKELRGIHKVLPCNLFGVNEKNQQRAQFT
jgi:hypothetical protein